MDLIRFGQRETFQREDTLTALNDEIYSRKAIRAIFRSFGRGKERTSDFAIDLEWPDVEQLIQEFVDLKHTDAVRLQDSMRLSKAAENVGWNPSPPSGRAGP